MVWVPLYYNNYVYNSLSIEKLEENIGIKMLKKTKVRKHFNEAGIQINIDALNLLEDEVKRIMNMWIRRTKQGNIKRLTADLIWIALMKKQNPTVL